MVGIENRPLTLFTVGHSNRSVDELLVLLTEADVRCLIDVRAYPGSRRHPQFSRAPLQCSLLAASLNYVWEGKALGGLRKSSADSPHKALHSDSLRAYADHMASAEFLSAIERVRLLGREVPCALMCAEANPYECHRQLIADYLTMGGATVMHLLTGGKREQHRLNSSLRWTDSAFVYDDSGKQLDLGL
jgi:uncharacterized protein (DUF488 family)